MKASKKAWLAVLLAALCLYGCTPQTPAESPDDGVLNSVVNPAELFSFRYAGEASADFLSEWLYEETKMETETGHQQTCTWTDESTGLRVALELTYRDAEPALEWVARLENTGSADTALIEALHIADFCLTDGLQPTEPVKLCYSKGTDVSESDFLFQEEELPVGRVRAFQPSGGRSSSGDVMPYFNLCTETGGVLIAIGWTGQWQAVFERHETDVRVTAGMETTHFVLHPGEAVRTPSVAVLNWQGTEEQSYQQWRQYMLQYHTPHDANGEPIVLPLTQGAWGGDSAEQHLNTLQYLTDNAYDYDAYWVDAGWYGDEDRHSSSQYGEEWFQNVGNWNHNTALYPDGLSPISEAAHAAGLKFLLWFEPERAWFDSQLVQKHGDWFLTTDETASASCLLNLCNPAARTWMADFLSDKIQTYGVDIYRQDFNLDPLPYWQAADADNRVGVTEMQYIDGLYRFLDELTAKNPGLMLDNCAGGGRRLDYEMLTRALPLFRSDYQCSETYRTTPVQIQTDGLSRWVPLSGTCVQYRPGDTVSFRSNLSYAMQFAATDQTEWQRAMIEQFHRAQPCFLGNYYRISTGNLRSERHWFACQWERPDLQSGMLLAFRRERAKNAEETLQLRIPSGTRQVTLTDADTGDTWTVSAANASDGILPLSITIESASASRLIFYQLVTSSD